MTKKKSRWRGVRWWEGKGNGRVSRRMWESRLNNKEKVEERWSMEGKGRDVLWAVLWDEGGGT